MSKFAGELAGMRFVGLVLVSVFAFSAARVCPGETGSESDRRAIHGVLVAQQDAWNRGDVEAFFDGYWGVGRGAGALQKELSGSRRDGAARFFQPGISFSGRRSRIGVRALAFETGQG